MDDQHHAPVKDSRSAPALLAAALLSPDGQLPAADAGVEETTPEISPFAAQNLAAAEAKRQRREALRLRHEARKVKPATPPEE